MLMIILIVRIFHYINFLSISDIYIICAHTYIHKHTPSCLALLWPQLCPDPKLASLPPVSSRRGSSLYGPAPRGGACFPLLRLCSHSPPPLSVAHRGLHFLLCLLHVCSYASLSAVLISGGHQCPYPSPTSMAGDLCTRCLKVMPCRESSACALSSLLWNEIESI